MIQSSSTTSSTDSGVPLSERMGGMNKSTEETVLPSSVSVSTAQGVKELTDPTSNVQMVSAPTAQGVEEVTDPTSNVQMLDRNTGSEAAIFGDRTQGIITAYDVPSEDVPIPSANREEIRTQSVVDPPCPEKEICFPEVPVSNPTGVQDRVCPEWMNTPASSSHPSPGSYPDRPNTPVSRMSLNEISLRARFIQVRFT
ncbi:hypothetical protein Nepgr_004123 [Nepenthes gracilis]|uniref:Uncharacterized protein n=1 Tax=Nepenthes gracilis TaxID=150966 RepID=A0AAD3S0V0_NEPGR|nr:hypothetical protein Nepgr_004123 [Nepenthes gracilis]